MEVCPSRPWGMVDGVAAPVDDCRALLRVVVVGSVTLQHVL